MSLRKLELDGRREAGIIVRSGQVVCELLSTFEEDWAQTDSGKKAAESEKKTDASSTLPSATA
jgi:hypothetical protein